MEPVLRSATGRSDRIIATIFNLRAVTSIPVSGLPTQVELIGVTTGLSETGTGMRVRIVSHALDRGYLMANLTGEVTLDLGWMPMREVHGEIVRAESSWDPGMDAFLAVKFEELSAEQRHAIQHRVALDQLERRAYTDADLCHSILSAYGYHGCFFCTIPDCEVRQSNQEAYRRLTDQRIKEINTSGFFDQNGILNPEGVK